MVIGLIGALTAGAYFVRRVENAINPPRSWVAVEMERRAVPHGLEVDDGISLVYTMTALPVFILVAMIAGLLGIVTLGVGGALAALILAGTASHVVGMHVCGRVIDAGIRAQLDDA